MTDYLVDGTGDLIVTEAGEPIIVGEDGIFWSHAWTQPPHFAGVDMAEEESTLLLMGLLRPIGHVHFALPQAVQIRAVAHLRKDDEVLLAALVAKLLKEQMDRVLVDPDWAHEEKVLIDTLEPMLAMLAYREATRELNKLEKRKADGIWDKIVAWAGEYMYELVGNINESTRKQLAAAIQEFVGRPMTMGELREKVADVFGPERAQMIAVTEVTRAYTQGGNAAADELREAGLEIVDVWHTENDELVCDDCQHEGKPRGDGWEDDPPVHPGCRCGVSHEVA